jgi:hypothetical protein
MERTTLKISGGRLINAADGVCFVGDDGRVSFFRGVSFSTRGVVRNAAYQLCGCIHISAAWAASGFNLRNFAHEYGHYIQQRRLGLWRYIWKIALPSVYSVFSDARRHAGRAFEQEATALGSEYLSRSTSGLEGDSFEKEDGDVGTNHHAQHYE